MREAAQGEPIKHEVFEKPFKLEPVYESWKTPSNYRRFPGGEKPISVWKVLLFSLGVAVLAVLVYMLFKSR